MGGVYIKPENINFRSDDNVFNNQFLHNLWDTITIGKNKIVIDSVNHSISKIHFKNVTNLTTKENAFGSTINEKIKNFQVFDINKKSTELYSLTSKKEFTLIDFWGTWCGPCLKQTPLIKNFHEKFNNKVTLIGIAKDDNLVKVQKYIKNKKLNWNHLIVNKDLKSNIIEELNISYYPTLILLDKDQNILYRGSDLNVIIEMLNKN